MKKIALFALALCSLFAGPALAAGPTAQTSATKTVSISGFAYKPAALTISKGTTVRFANNDKVAHTATRAGGFNTKRIGAGKAASVRFNARGSFNYHCTIHPEMRGKIVVQ
jgi:plastocyanin